MLAAETVYEKIKQFLDAHPSGWVKEVDVRAFISSEVDFGTLCVSLKDLKDYEKLECLLRFLEIAIVYLSTEFSSPQYEEYLLEAVRSPSDRLRAIVSTVVSHFDKSVLPTETQFNILMVLLSDEETGIAVKADRTLFDWVKQFPQLGSRLVSYYEENKSSMNETVQFRFLTICINLGEISESLFSVFIPIFLQIVQIFKTDDILLKLGSLTLIELLSKYSYGQEFLTSSNMLNILEPELLSNDSTTVITVLLTMASIVGDNEKVLKKMLPIIQQFIISSNSVERICAMKVLTLISCESFLRANWKLFDQVVYAITDFTDIEIINAALDTVCQVIKNWDRNVLLESAAAQHRLADQLLTTFQRHPFPESRALVYAALAHMVHSGLVDSVMDKLFKDPASVIRRAIVDATSETRDLSARAAKCDLVRVLVREKMTRYFGPDEVADLERFAKLGLQYVPAKQRDELETEAF